VQAGLADDIEQALGAFSARQPERRVEREVR
jgi:hypothetical protein